MSRNFNPADSGYIDVAERIAEFRSKYPDGALQPTDPANPYKIETIGSQTFIVYTAAAYRSPDDKMPGIATAWEPFPGSTPYTRNSELMNAETSAWGRAIIAVLAADSKRGIATSEEVRNRQAERDQQAAAVPQQRDAQGWPVGASPARGQSRQEHPQASTREQGEALINQALLSKLGKQFTTLGVADRDEGLMTIAMLTGIKVGNTRELTVAQARRLIGVLDPLTKAPDPSAALTQAIQEAMQAMQAEQQQDGPAVHPTEEKHHAAA